MAIAHQGANGANGTSTTISVPNVNNVTHAGRLLVVAITWKGSASATESLPAGWFLLDGAADGDLAFNVIARHKPVFPTDTSFTLGLSASVPWRVRQHIYSGQILDTQSLALLLSAHGIATEAGTDTTIATPTVSASASGTDWRLSGFSFVEDSGSVSISPTDTARSLDDASAGQSSIFFYDSNGTIAASSSNTVTATTNSISQKVAWIGLLRARQDPGIGSDAMGLTDSVTITETKVPVDNENLTDTRAFSQTKVRQDNEGLTDTIRKSQTLFFRDNAGGSDGTVFSILEQYVDSAGITEVVGFRQDKVYQDSIGITDSVVGATGPYVQFQDTVTITDSLQFPVFRLVTPKDQITWRLTMAQEYFEYDGVSVVWDGVTMTAHRSPSYEVHDAAVFVFYGGYNWYTRSQTLVDAWIAAGFEVVTEVPPDNTQLVPGE